MGIALSFLREHIPPKNAFKEEHISDLNGKVYIVTGANTGIGKETVKTLLSHGAKVYLAARSSEKAEVAIAELKAQTGKEAYFLKLDLSEFNSIELAAKEFLSKENRLDVLINNAGVMWPPIDWVTPEGYDWQFGCNVLGPFYFTKLLLPIMLETAKEPLNPSVRIVNVASFAHRLHGAGDVLYDTLRDGPARKKLSAFDLYNQSKFAMVLFSRELARRYGDKGIISIGLNPGSISSDLQRHSSLPKFLGNLVLYSVTQGASTSLWAATCPEGADLNGKYLVPWARVGKAEESTDSPEKAENLWNWLEEQIKGRTP